MKKFYFLFLFALIASISNLYAAEKTVTSTFKDKDLTVGVGEPGWVASITANSFESNNNNRGVQFGAAKGAFTLKTSESFSQVKKVSVILSTNEKVNTVSLKVGGTSVDGMKTLSKRNNYAVNWSVVSPQDGIIEFSFNDKKGSIYIKSISITYEGGSETQCATPTFSVEEGTYSEAQAIKLTAGEGGEVVYYTINDGPEQQYIDEPIKLEEDGTYKISAYTAATETLGKSATVTKTYVINFPLEVPYILCQNAAWLTEGTKIIFVGKNATTGGAFGMAAQNGTKYREQDIVTLSGDEKSLISKGDKVRVFTVEKSGNDIAFKDIEGYLSADNTKNSIQTKKTIGSDSYWTVSVAADGVATVASKTATTYKCIMYNAGNTPRFSAYKADFDGAVYIYLLGSTSSVSSMSAEGVKVFAAEGGVEVVAEEAAEVAVYTVAGQLVRQAHVAEGSTLVNVAPGFYVVRANGTATKVIVR